MSRLILFLAILTVAAAALVELGERDVPPVVITHEDEQKVILLFGKPRAVVPWGEEKVTKPGITLAIPFLEQINTYSSQLLYLDAAPSEILTKDGERIAVDNYVIWQIVDAIQYLSSFPSGDQEAEAQIGRIVRADVREAIGRNTLQEVLDQERTAIIQAITERSREKLADDGIHVVDVRINRTELPALAQGNVYERMKTDRERLARKSRAEGAEEARRIRAEAEREARVIVANARKQAEITRGEGEATAARVYAEAYEGDAEFYEFTRSLEAYRKTLGEGTTMVLSPDAEFFQHLQGKE